MKILYALQGTGNGHISRANALLPRLQDKLSQPIDVLISGTHSELDTVLPARYKLKGAGFIFGKNGGIDVWNSFKNLRAKSFYDEVRALPIASYDLVINDFEPVSAMAARLKGVPCIGMGHQAAFHFPETPRKEGFPFSSLILKYYAPTPSHIGIHFKSYNQEIYLPVIREEIRSQKSSRGQHYTVYLPAFGTDQLYQIFTKFPHVHFEVFSKHIQAEERYGNVNLRPIQNDAYINSLVNCKGAILGGGFEGPAEALYLGKKLLVVPMVNQYEQHCNALALSLLGVSVAWKPAKLESMLGMWLSYGKEIQMKFPDQEDAMLDYCLWKGRQAMLSVGNMLLV